MLFNNLLLIIFSHTVIMKSESHCINYKFISSRNQNKWDLFIHDAFIAYELDSRKAAPINVLKNISFRKSLFLSRNGARTLFCNAERLNIAHTAPSLSKKAPKKNVAKGQKWSQRVSRGWFAPRNRCVGDVILSSAASHGAQHIHAASFICIYIYTYRQTSDTGWGIFLFAVYIYLYV